MAFADDFSDGPEEDRTPPLLPPEDRIWRHPSELGAAEQPFVLDPLQVRRRWLANQPTKASAWTAGLVGAILATGVVALGTHLANAFTGSHVGVSSTTMSGPSVTPTNGPVSTMAIGSSSLPVTDSVTAMIDRVAEATATITISTGARDDYARALVVSSNGDLVAPLAAIAGNSSVLVSVPGDAPYVGTVIASDANSGVAVLRVKDPIALRTAPFATDSPVAGELVWALGANGSPAAWGGTIRSVDETAGRANWPIEMTADVPASRAPVGTPLIDDEGRVAGIVTGAAPGGGIEAVPSWLAGPVADDLASSGAVLHGWLGVECDTAYHSGAPDGAFVIKVLGPPAGGELEANDVISGLDGQPITTYEALQSRLYAMRPGADVALSVERGKSELTIEVKLASAR